MCVCVCAEIRILWLKSQQRPSHLVSPSHHCHGVGSLLLTMIPTSVQGLVLPGGGLVRCRWRLGLGELAGEGRTLVALDDVPPGARLLSEKPTVVAGCRDELEARLAALLAADDSALAPAVPRASAAASGGQVAAAAAAAATFAFDFLDGGCWVFFSVLGVLNHACAGSEEANCCISVPFDAGAPEVDTFVHLVAVRGIRAGEVLRMPYFCPFALSQLDAMQVAHGFRCRCSCCRFGAPSTIAHRCAACGLRDSVKLSRCSRCRGVRYCSAECQRRHWKEHRSQCSAASPEDDDAAFLCTSQEEYDAAMAASGAALQEASQALRRRERFAGELALEESLQLAGSFLARRTDGSPALRGTHPFVYYASGNFVKQALSRLAMRLRLLGREPRGGCGALALRARRLLEACLDAALTVLPRFQVEVYSLLVDVRDLRDVVTNLQGLAPELEAHGLPNEGQISEEGLGEVFQWCTKTLDDFGDVLATYDTEDDDC